MLMSNHRIVNLRSLAPVCNPVMSYLTCPPHVAVCVTSVCFLLILSTLSKCGHAVVATLYPFTWQHTYIPVLPASMIDIVCSPTPFLIGILSCSLPQLQDLPIEEGNMGEFVPVKKIGALASRKLHSDF